MKDFSLLAATRRSMRKFAEELLSQDDVVTLLKAALMSPSSKGSHCWEFVVVDDKAKLEELSRCKDKGAELVAHAPLAVVVLARPEVSDVWIEDASVATTMLLLQAEDLGLGACWVQVRERYTADGRAAEDMVRQALEIPAERRVLSIVALGHKGMERKPFDESRLLWEKVFINTYNNKE